MQNLSVKKQENPHHKKNVKKNKTKTWRKETKNSARLCAEESSLKTVWIHDHAKPRKREREFVRARELSQRERARAARV